VSILRIVAASAFLAGIQPVCAQEQGDPKRGLSYAEKACTECHGVLAEDDISPLLDAPTFRSVANTPGMTYTALSVWFQSPHPSMPNLIIPPEDLANVIAYIMSLKDVKEER
jgi:mono/diheme cytochrome c family protein